MKNTAGKIGNIKESANVSKRLLIFLWQSNKYVFVGMLVAISIPAIVPFINAYIYKLIIDLIVEGTGVRFDYQLFYKLIALRFITLLVQYLAFSLQTYMDTVLWTQVPVKLYQLILTKLASLDVEYFESSQFKDMLQRVKEGYAWRPLNLYTSLFYTFQSVLQLTIAAIALATLNLALAAALTLAALPAFIIQVYYSKNLWGVWAENSPYRKKFWYLSELLQNKQGVAEMKIFKTAPKFLSEISTMQKKFARENLSVSRKRLAVSSALNFAGAAVAVAIEAFVAFLTIGGKITLGSLSYFTFVIFNFESSAAGFFGNLAAVFNHSLYVKDIIKVLDLPTRVEKAKNPIIINSKIAPKIEFKNVSFTYPQAKKPTLQNFTMTIEPGQKIALVGANGAGKTTVIKLLARFYDTQNGEILINGHNIKKLDLNTWHKNLGIIFQDFIKYEYTLGENIHFGKIYEKFDLAKIVNAATQTGVDKIAKKLPKGYDQTLGLTFEKGSELSQGEWQKVALARAFLRNAPILVLDEPTSSIDAKSEAQVFDQVEKLGKNKSVIIISHRFSTVKNADVIYVLDKGKIIEKGNHASLIKKDGVYAKLYRSQAQRYK